MCSPGHRTVVLLDCSWILNLRWYKELQCLYVCREICVIFFGSFFDNFHLTGFWYSVYVMQISVLELWHRPSTKDCFDFLMSPSLFTHLSRFEVEFCDS